MKIDYDSLKKAFYNQNNPSERWKKMRTGLFVIIFIAAVFIGLMYFIDKEEANNIINFVTENRTFAMGVVIVIVLMMMASASGNVDKDKKKIKEYNDILNGYSQKADLILEKAENVFETSLFRYIRSNEIIKVYRPFYYWIKNNILTLFEMPPKDVVQHLNLEPFTVELNQIKYFELIGEKFYENKISGGGSQEGDLSKAIVGQALFGTAGAVVGGQQKIDPIKSELILHDNRETRIVLHHHEGGISEMIVRFDFYQMLKELLPDKDKLIVDEIMKQNIINKQINPITDNLSDKLKLLEKLKNDSTIDETEYQNRKNKLLDDALK